MIMRLPNAACAHGQQHQIKIIHHANNRTPRPRLSQGTLQEGLQFRPNPDDKVSLL